MCSNLHIKLDTNVESSSPVEILSHSWYLSLRCNCYHLHTYADQFWTWFLRSFTKRIYNSLPYHLRPQIWIAFPKSSWEHTWILNNFLVLSSHEFNCGVTVEKKLPVCHHIYSPWSRLHCSSDYTPDWCKFIAQLEYIFTILVFFLLLFALFIYLYIYSFIY